MMSINDQTCCLNLLSESGSVVDTLSLADKSTFRIGRGDANDLQLKFSWVSRQHAMIQKESNGTYNIIDLGSANGTFVNGRHIQAITKLHRGDRIGIGQTILVFFQEDIETTTGCSTLLDEQTVAFVNRQIVTVLVSDLRDFTRLSEKIGDSLTTKILQVWNTKVNDLVNAHDGVVDKFIGDAVMALWIGGPGPRFSIRQALRTALAIEKLTCQLHEKITGIPWPLRTGAAINTGDVVVGNIGGGNRREFTVIGDAVNVVFRLEEMTGQAGFDLLLGEEAGKHIRDADALFEKKRFFLKGKEEAVTAYGTSFPKLQDLLNKGTKN